MTCTQVSLMVQVSLHPVWKAKIAQGSGSQDLPVTACRQVGAASSPHRSSLAFLDGRSTAAWLPAAEGSPLSTFWHSLATWLNRAHPVTPVMYPSSCMSLWYPPACVLATQQLAAPNLSACLQSGSPGSLSWS